MSDISVLLVEDDDVDAEAFERVMLRLDAGLSFARVGDAETALVLLESQVSSSEGDGTHLVLLDLNLPGMSGLEFLTRVRGHEDPRIRGTIVFVLTTSEDERDRRAAYDQCVAGYIRKGRMRDTLTGLFGILGGYRAVVTPPN